MIYLRCFYNLYDSVLNIEIRKVGCFYCLYLIAYVVFLFSIANHKMVLIV